MWKTLRCEVRGSRTDESLQRGKIVEFNDLNVSVLCLSDGDYNSKLSHFGSSIVTQRASEYVTLNFDELYEKDDLEMKESLLSYILISLKKQASMMSVTLDELASNLLLIAVKNNKYVAFSLGDGIIGCCVEGHMQTLFSGGREAYVTFPDALRRLELKRGLVKGVKGFTLMSSGTANTLYSAVESDFLDVVGEIISSNDSSTEEEMNTKLSEAFDEYVIRKTDNDCSVAILTSQRSASIYKSLSIDEKILFFKLSLFDTNSANRVKELDNILELITTEKSIEDLSKVLSVKAVYLKPKLDILVECNLLTLYNTNVYKKVN